MRRYVEMDVGVTAVKDYAAVSLLLSSFFLLIYEMGLLF